MSFLKFDYYCNKCRNVYDVTVESRVIDTEQEKELTQCPECGGVTKRLFPAPIWKWAAGCRGF